MLVCVMIGVALKIFHLVAFHGVGAKDIFEWSQTWICTGLIGPATVMPVNATFLYGEDACVKMTKK